MLKTLPARSSLRNLCLFLLLLFFPLLLRAQPSSLFLSVELAKVLYDRKQAIFMDVRGKASYEAEHIEGAVLFPLTELQQGKVPPLPHDTLIILYCGCPHGLSEEAARILLQKGFSSVYVLDEGFYGWKEKGYPVRSNPKKLEGFKEWRIVGSVRGASEGTKIFVKHIPTGEVESFIVLPKGSFQLFFPLYGAREGDILEFRFGEKTIRHPLKEKETLELNFASPQR